MRDFRHAHGVVSDVEIIAMRQIVTACKGMMKGEARPRFVVDMASLMPA